MNYALRSLLRRVSQNVVLKRKLPMEFGAGTIYVTPGSMLRYWRWDLRRVDGRLLANVLALVTPGASVWDIGANVGMFGLAAAGKTGADGSVLLVEPDQVLVRLLRASVGTRAVGKPLVEVLPAAVADQVGVARLNVARGGRAMNYLDGGGSPEAGGARRRDLVITVTLDWLLERFRRPDVVKIDVEGAEMSVLRGGAGLLASARPVILCEVFPRNADAVTAILAEHRYRMFDANSAGEARKPIEIAAWNTLAVPVERSSSTIAE